VTFDEWWESRHDKQGAWRVTAEQMRQAWNAALREQRAARAGGGGDGGGGRRMFENVSDKYKQQIADLTDWFVERLPALGPVVLTEGEHKVGVDSLSGDHAELAREAFDVWLSERRYELSYNQTCNAFFAAAGRCGLLDVTG
jgi:hypothetical protein